MIHTGQELTAEQSAARAHGVFARGVARRFGDVQAVAGIDLTAPPGQVTALIGGNGAGKTTLLLILASLLVPDAGQVRVAGFDPVTDPDAVRASLGWSPDTFGLYEELTAREHLEFVAGSYLVPKGERRDRAMHLLGLVHLQDLAARPVSVFSRGQKQRLGLARALVHSPRVLLLDEPAAGLDPRSRVELQQLLRSVAAQGAAVVVSSHVLSDLEELADRVVVVERGRTVRDAPIAELRGDGGGDGGAQPAWWRLRSLDPDALVAALQAAGAGYRPPHPGGVDVELRGDADAAGLLAHLVGQGVPVVSCAPVSGSLESAYLAMTENAPDRR